MLANFGADTGGFAKSASSHFARKILSIDKSANFWH